MRQGFLPVTREEMLAKGWSEPDFVYVSGDAYVDHPSFGLAIISRVLEHEGYRICMLPQPDWHTKDDFMRFGRPKYGFLVGSGVVDSMVNNYTAAKKRRNDDVYSPGGKGGRRPDRALIVYCNRIREAYSNIFIAIGGVEASLRRFAHYDYWDDKVRSSMLVDSGADILMFGMGEETVVEVAKFAESRRDYYACDIPGTCVMSRELPADALELPSAEEVMADKQAYCKAFMMEYDNQDPIRGKRLAQKDGARWLIQNVPTRPLDTKKLDYVYALNYTRSWHPMYESEGGVPALSEVEFSIVSERGCFGSCNFCALTFHQGRIVTSRSKESILREAKLLTQSPAFKGYIHDVGGPTANFRHPSCQKQLKAGTCSHRQCLFPKPCPNIDADHSEYIDILTALRNLPKVKKVFVRSGIRYDYMLLDKKNSLLEELVKHHISGQLKVAPEHISPKVLYYMGKPGKEVFEEFRREYEKSNKRNNKRQFLVPYFMSSHPGCTLEDAIMLAEYMKKTHLHPEQVQDFYPTPGTLSTCMFYTGIDPRTGKKVYVAKSYEEKAMQRALMQYNHPQNRELVIKALKKAGRLDLIGHGENCLISYSAPRRFKNGTAEAVHNGNKTQPTRDARKGKGHEAENKPRNRHK
ncbi:MAG: YgiQ family radical SAM protein [Clostridia bacterium]|nr:YgiQ family radical SAM protein [Clostridia bacterium]